MFFLLCQLVFYLSFSGPSMKSSVHTERPESGILFKIFEKTQYLINTLYDFHDHRIRKLTHASALPIYHIRILRGSPMYFLLLPTRPCLHVSWSAPGRSVRRLLEAETSRCWPTLPASPTWETTLRSRHHSLGMYRMSLEVLLSYNPHVCLLCWSVGYVGLS